MQGDWSDWWNFGCGSTPNETRINSAGQKALRQANIVNLFTHNKKDDIRRKDLEKKSNFVKSIGEAFQKIGFCAVKGHFLDDELVDKLYKQIKLFFDLDFLGL